MAQGSSPASLIFASLGLTLFSYGHGKSQDVGKDESLLFSPYFIDVAKVSLATG